MLARSPHDAPSALAARPAAPRRGVRAASLFVAGSLLALALAPIGPGVGVADDGDDPDPEVMAASKSCITCHEGIEEMHPSFPLGCTDCHGGDANATDKDKAHVQPSRKWPNDETVLPLKQDLPFQRFRNPSNLRVAMDACGECHEDEVKNLLKSLHGTTAGHLNDGLYENGVLRKRGSKFSIFTVRDERPATERDPNALASLTSIRGYRSGKPNEIPTHYRDVPRKACMRCHLWGEGRGVRGRLGMDGDYRSQGCAACHVTYADDGLSRSADETIDKLEPGHGKTHRFTNAIPTDTCTRCHYGDASIGMHFRGLAQLVPGMPAGPQVPNTTEYRLNGTYYFSDPKATPPDIHHEKGMHCIDCHTFEETMGDGNIYGAMEHALEVDCQHCHGTFTERADLKTKKGNKLSHLRREGDQVILTSKVTGEEHEVTQLVDLLNRKSPRYSKAAAEAMTKEHAKLACHACHTSWNVNFFGFHFDRNEGFTQLDQLSGKRTDGRVTTLEKVFSTFKQYTLGYNSMGHISPYLVGFSTMCTAVDEKGQKVLDQAFPETAEGLSGLTMIHHHVHTVRPRTRTCVECHRAPTTWGLGSPHYELARRILVAGTGRSIEVWAFDRKKLGDSQRIAEVTTPEVNDIALITDKVQGYSQMAIAATAEGMTLVDMRNPAEPRLIGTLPTTQARGVYVHGRLILLADGPGGLRIFELDKRGRPEQLGQLETKDARAVFADGFEAFVADGTGGLKVISIENPKRPKLVAEVENLNGDEKRADDARSLTVFFQYSRSQGPNGRGGDRPRSPARRLCFIANGASGMACVDVTDPTKPALLNPRAYRRLGGNDNAEARAVASGSLFDLGSEDGGIPTEENDYIYVLVGRKNNDGNEQDGRLGVVRVTNPLAPRVVNADARFPNWGADVAVAHIYNPPFLQHYALTAVGGGGAIIEASRSNAPENLGLLGTNFNGLQGNDRRKAWWRCIAVEQYPLDRMIDEDGQPLKDVSHEGARYLNRKELKKVLGAKLPRSAYAPTGGGGARRGRRGRR